MVKMLVGAAVVTRGEHASSPLIASGSRIIGVLLESVLRVGVELLGFCWNQYFQRLSREDEILVENFISLKLHPPDFQSPISLVHS